MGDIASSLCLCNSGYIYSVFLIFIYNLTFGQRRFTKKNWMGSGNWPSVLGNTLAVLHERQWVSRDILRANLRACRLSTASFRTLFFPSTYSFPRLPLLMLLARASIPPSFQPKFSYHEFHHDGNLDIFSPHFHSTFNTRCQFLLTHILKLGTYFDNDIAIRLSCVR